MPINGGFFPAIETSPGIFDRSYTSGEYANRWKDFIKNGVAVLDGGQLTTENELTKVLDTMKSQVAEGNGWVEGYYYKVTSAVEVDHVTADPTNPRIDRVVLELNLETPTRAFVAKAITGVPAPSPIAPDLTRNAQIYQISVGRILIPAGESTLNNATVTDERSDEAVCGIANVRVGIQPGVILDSIVEITSTLTTITGANQKELNESIDSNITTIASSISDIETDLTAVDDRVSDIETDLTVIKSSVQTTKEAISYFPTDTQQAPILATLEGLTIASIVSQESVANLGTINFDSVLDNKYYDTLNEVILTGTGANIVATNNSGANADMVVIDMNATGIESYTESEMLDISVGSGYFEGLKSATPSIKTTNNSVPLLENTFAPNIELRSVLSGVNDELTNRSGDKRLNSWLHVQNVGSDYNDVVQSTTDWIIRFTSKTVTHGFCKNLTSVLGYSVPTSAVLPNTIVKIGDVLFKNITNTDGNTNDEENTFFIGGDDELRFSVNKTTYPNSASFEAYLQANDVEFLFELETPVGANVDLDDIYSFENGVMYQEDLPVNIDYIVDLNRTGAIVSTIEKVERLDDDVKIINSLIVAQGEVDVVSGEDFLDMSDLSDGVYELIITPSAIFQFRPANISGGMKEIYMNGTSSSLAAFNVVGSAVGLGPVSTSNRFEITIVGEEMFISQNIYNIVVTDASGTGFRVGYSSNINNRGKVLIFSSTYPTPAIYRIIKKSL